ncbi:hypothetical protein Lepto7375DRAFT_4778 [Leptolyngbya sp. PCC 7375]|nr:hypothetical protein Lepto7375DRAFT_4778 [Leptolyngbya sp. PCC 7375]
MIHIEPLELKHLLVITSEFHIPRTKAVFEWIYHLEGLSQDYQVVFEAVSDDGIDATTLRSRQQKENAS